MAWKDHSCNKRLSTIYKMTFMSWTRLILWVYLSIQLNDNSIILIRHFNEDERK